MRHPDPRSLQGYVVGSLAPEAAEEVERHLTACASCEETVNGAAMSGYADELVDLLTAPDEPDPYDHEPGLRQMLERVERLIAIGMEATPDSAVSLPEGRRAPDRLGEYDLGEPLGSGGMGAVYRGFHRHLGRSVAIKLLNSDRLNDPAATERFRREMRAVGALEHAHIVRALDAGEADGTLYLVMELVDGLPLSDVAARIGPWPVEDACEAVRQAAIGIAAAHRVGMIHRDVKPGNLMLARLNRDDEKPQAVVKALDLGLARFHEAGTPRSGELTSAGQVMGTVDYMAPEQADSSRNVGPAADVYSLGATLYRLLTGRTPLDVGPNASLMQRLAALASRSAPPVASLRPDLPAALAKIVDSALDRDPTRRPSAIDLSRLLLPFTKDADLVALLDRSRSSGSGSEQALVPTVTSSAPGLETSSDLSFYRSPLPDTKSRPSRRGARFWAFAGAGAAIPALVLGVVFFLRTPNGTLRIEIEDPAVEVKVKGTEIALRGVGEQTVTLEPGDHVLRVKRGDFEFDTTSLRLNRGEVAAVVVEFVDGTVHVTNDGKTIGSATPNAPPLETSSSSSLAARPATATVPPATDPTTTAPPEHPEAERLAEILDASTVWEGTRTYRHGAFAGLTVHYAVHFRQSTDQTLGGDKFDNGRGRNFAVVTGHVEGTKLTWHEQAPRGDSFDVEGEFVGDEIRLTFEGSYPNGAPTEGDGTLKLVPP